MACNDITRRMIASQVRQAVSFYKRRQAVGLRQAVSAFSAGYIRSDGRSCLPGRSWCSASVCRKVALGDTPGFLSTGAPSVHKGRHSPVCS